MTTSRKKTSPKAAPRKSSETAPPDPHSFIVAHIGKKVNRKSLKSAGKSKKQLKSLQNSPKLGQNGVDFDDGNGKGRHESQAGASINEATPEITRAESCDFSPSNSSISSDDASASPGSWVYSDLVKEHFLNPRNFLMGDEAKYQYDAEGTVGNPICGDQMRMFLQIRDDKIVDVKWKTYGCASAIASTSALSELAKSKTLDQALEIGPEEITEYLGGLPKHKFHCSVLGYEALAKAIENYRKGE